jgi:hypothetical protein
MASKARPAREMVAMLSGDQQAAAKVRMAYRQRLQRQRRCTTT